MAVASPIRSVPRSQTTPSSPPSDSPSAADHSDAFRRSLSLPRDADLQAASRTEEYRQLFRLPSEVVLIQDFNCALQESILLQGHMYLFDNYICFYSNIFGFETKKIIPLNEVTAVRRAKTAGLFPNAIEIVASGKKHFFASFLSRDEAFKLIEECWSEHSHRAGLTCDQDFKSETGSQLDESISIENSRNSEVQLDYLDSEERGLDVPVVEDPKVLNNNKDCSMDPSTSEARAVVDKFKKLVNHADSSMPESSNKWEDETSDDPPEIPKHYTKVAESKFPVKVEDFFNLFCSDDAIGFIESFRTRCGDKEFNCTNWSPHDKLGRAREMSFQHPIKVYFGAKCGGCKEIQSYRVYKNSHLVIQTSQEVSDVPYADYFKVEGLWDVRSDGSQSKDGCILEIYTNVAFSKRTVWKSKIEQSTIEECRDAYATWIELAHELLKQKNLEKPEEGVTRSGIEQPLVQSSAGVPEPTGRLSGEAGSRRTTTLSPNLVVSEIITAIASPLGAVSGKICSSLKDRVDLQRLSIIIFALILLLMQLSIVVLLSRPQQIHIIPQTNPANLAGPGTHTRDVGEASAWLDRRIHLLKGEMSAAEAQLERMQREHTLLKAQLTELEHFRNKQR